MDHKKKRWKLKMNRKQRWLWNHNKIEAELEDWKKKKSKLLGADNVGVPENYKEFKFPMVKVKINPRKKSFNNLKITGTENGRYTFKALGTFFNMNIYEKLLWTSTPREMARKFLMEMRNYQKERRIPTAKINAIISRLNIMKDCGRILTTLKFKGIRMKDFRKEPKKYEKKIQEGLEELQMKIFFNKENLSMTVRMSRKLKWITEEKLEKVKEKNESLYKYSRSFFS